MPQERTTATIRELQDLRNRVEEIRDDILTDAARLEMRLEKLAKGQEELLEAWRTATGLVKFIKFAAGFGTAVGVIYTIIKTYFTGNP